MDDPLHAPTLDVHRVTLGGLIPLARYYSCIRCDHDLSDWVMEQSACEPSPCPNCHASIDASDIAQAQRDTRFGCFWTLASIVGFVGVMAALVGVLWLFTGPQPLIRFR
jgi:hypothetical protein